MCRWRFISQDPARQAGSGHNWYAYTNNSPTNLTDPSGLKPRKSPPACVGIRGEFYSKYGKEGWGDSCDAKLAIEGITEYRDLISSYIAFGVSLISAGMLLKSLNSGFFFTPIGAAIAVLIGAGIGSGAAGNAIFLYRAFNNIVKKIGQCESVPDGFVVVQPWLPGQMPYAVCQKERYLFP